jgi:hypothetical protein
MHNIIRNKRKNVRHKRRFEKRLLQREIIQLLVEKEEGTKNEKI